VLAHIRLVHDIVDAEQFTKAYEEIETDALHKDQFAKFQEELWEQKTKGQITAEEYRSRIAQWLKENKGGA